MDQLLSMAPALLAMIAVWYFLVIRPQDQEVKVRKDMLAALVKDDMVATAAGFHGKVVSVAAETIVLEIAKGVSVTLDKSAVVRKLAADGK